MKREDVRAFVNRRWDLVAQSKEDYWVEARAKMSLAEAFDLADGLRLSAIKLLGRAFLEDRDDDYAHHVALKRKLERAHAASRK